MPGQRRATALKRRHAGRHLAFTILELLVVIGIIAVILALLMPALASVREGANQTKCLAQLHDLGLALQIYQNHNDGWLYPVGIHPITGTPHGLGSNKPPHERWPMLAFTIDGAPLPPPYDPLAYDKDVYDPEQFNAELYTPVSMRCPSDVEPYESISYFLNSLLTKRYVKAGGGVDMAGRSTSDVIVAGEKASSQRDYFMQGDSYEFLRIVEPYRHGIKHFSNYLYMDGHAAAAPPSEIRRGLDPWGATLPTNVATTQPADKAP